MRLIKESQDTLIVKVVAPKPGHPKLSPHMDGTQTLPHKRGVFFFSDDCDYLLLLNSLMIV